MATVTKTFTETGGGSTWTVTVTGTDQTVSGNFNLNIPTVTAKYVYAAKNYAGASVAFSTNTSSSFAYNLPTDGWSDIAWASNATKTITNTSSSRSVTLSTLFNASNKTSKTANITATCNAYEIYLRSSRYSGGAVEYGHDYNNSSSVSLGTISTITLNAPPTVTLGTPTYAAPQYSGLGSYSVPVTQAKALYGGDVSSITLTVGADTVTQSYSSSTVSNQTLSLVPSQPGTFTPTLTVTDSRGQTKTESLSQITVNAYTAPTLSFDVSRCTSAGLIDVEGTYGLVTANIAYVDALAELTQPTVSAADENGSSVTVSASWYRSWDAVNGVSNAVNWTNYQPTSPVTLYAIVSVTGGSFSPNASYAISITPTDNMGGVASTITQTLATGFFTIDFQAGGKEIAFGAPANDTLTSIHGKNVSGYGYFKCGMEAQFEKDLWAKGLLQAENSLSYGVCNTASATVAKTVTVANSNFTLQTGATVAVKFTNANSASNPTLNVNSTGAVAIKRYGTTATGTNAASSWNANSVVCLLYDGTYWQQMDFNNNTYYIESCRVDTAAGTQAKVGGLSNYALQKGYLQVAIYNANTYAGAITLNINSTGAKPIYINGTASSASNYSLPKAMYFVYYDGTNYHFRTDGLIPQIMDSVVEQGTSGIWTYRKWNSGIAECWGKDTKSAAVNNSWGNGYISANLSTSFPSGLFNSAPTGISFFVSGSYSANIVNTGTLPTKDAISYDLFRTSSVSTGQTYYIHINAVGTWK